MEPPDRVPTPPKRVQSGISDVSIPPKVENAARVLLKGLDASQGGAQQYDPLDIERARPVFGSLDQVFLIPTALKQGRCRVPLHDALAIPGFGRAWIAHELNRLSARIARSALEQALTSPGGLVLGNPAENGKQPG